MVEIPTTITVDVTGLFVVAVLVLSTLLASTWIFQRVRSLLGR